MSATSQVSPFKLGAAQRTPQIPLLGALAVVVTALGWGLNWPATKLLIAACPPLSARGVAGAVACVILFIVATLRGESLRVARPERWRLVAGALLNVTAWMGGTTAALRWLPAGQAVTLAYTMPIWVCLLNWPILGERPTLRQIAAIVLGMVGIIVLVGPGSLSFERDDAPGIALALGSAMLFGLGTVFGKARPVSLGPLALTAWQVAVGSIPLLILGLWSEAPAFAALSLFAWVALAYTAVVSMGLCYVTWFVARSRLSAPAAAAGTLLTPVIGVAASSLALGDPLTAPQLVALMLVAGGIVLGSGTPVATR
nr:DMT family transporter [uncultured Rhodopila sp.]